MIYQIHHALEKLYPDGAGYIQEGTEYSGLKWVDERPKPTEKEINDKIKELQDDYDSKQYQRDRLQEYPSIQELVVALYDEEDKQALIEKRNAVKAKYPKPE